MDILKAIGAKGTIHLIETLEEKELSWTELNEKCSGVLALRTFITRLKQLEELGLIESDARMINKKAVKLYFLSEKGNILLKKINEIGLL